MGDENDRDSVPLYTPLGVSVGGWVNMETHPPLSSLIGC